MNLVLNDCSSHISRSRACQVLNLNRSTVHRRSNPDQPKPVRQEIKSQPRGLSVLEREQLWATMTSDEFMDQPPYEIYHCLLSRGECLASISTMHRLLREKAVSGLQ